ncbi:MAG: hypothetical protein U1D55_05995 [Phycisphaerae bacterium]
MSDAISFWKRLGSALGVTSPGNGHSLDAPNGHRATDAVNGGEGLGAAAAAAVLTDHAPRAAHSGGFWLRRTRGDEDRRRERVDDLISSIQQHFDRHDQRSAQLAASVDRVAGILEQLADTQRRQGECLSAIATSANATSKNTAALSACLLELPAAVGSQADAVRSVARKLEAANDTHAQLAGTLQRFGGAVDALRSSGELQVQSLERLSASENQAHEALSALVRSHGRWLLITGAAAGILALGAIVMMSILLFAR